MKKYVNKQEQLWQAPRTVSACALRRQLNTYSDEVYAVVYVGVSNSPAGQPDYVIIL